MKKPERLVLAKMLKRLATRIGARVTLEPNWQIAGQIRYPAKAGKAAYIATSLQHRRSQPIGSADISKDKDYATFSCAAWDTRPFRQSILFRRVV